jgi:hypothetical protein
VRRKKEEREEEEKKGGRRKGKERRRSLHTKRCSNSLSFARVWLIFCEGVY